MKRRNFIRLNATLAPGIFFYRNAKSFDFINDVNDSLKISFQNAAGPAPHTLWQWMNGCVTKEGITYDLEAFKKAGIKDVQQFLVGGIEADVTDPEITILGEKWMELMRFAMDECQRFGISFGTHNCPGWSASGAPGIQPADSMQKIVWTKTTVQGEDALIAAIPKPIIDLQWNYYEDICVVAFPAGQELLTKASIKVLLYPFSHNDSLQQKLPEGSWEVLRFGHTTTGSINGTAPVSGQGLEVDKMSKEALEKFWDLYPQKLIELAGKHAGSTFKRIEIDSYEAGEQTWTRKMPEEFKRRRGYDLLFWLPVLAGYTIETKELCNRFKYDWKRTMGELVSENYYQHLHTLIHRQPGIEFLIEPYGTGHGGLGEADVRGVGDVVMCEFWWGPNAWGWDSIFPVASNAHVNGKKIVAAEAFTATPQYAWRVDLFDLKAPGDRAFCNGVNHFYLHASAHQPWPHVQPGMTMGWWGTQFGPSQTWWYHGAAEWIQYISRCQMILQKGLFVADLCFLHPSKQNDPVVPGGFKADSCNLREFMNRFSVKGDSWVLPDGMRYKVLVLPDNFSPDLSVAKKILADVKQGGVIAGRGFKGIAGLQGFPMDESEVKAISNELFGSPSAPGKFERVKRSIGKGIVYIDYNIEEILSEENIAKDVELPEEEKDILWIHRKDNEEHFYFISNQADNYKFPTLSFRVNGLQPEIWNAESGSIINALLCEEKHGRTSVQLSFEPYGSVFVVFKQPIKNNTVVKEFKFDGKPANPLHYLLINNGKPAIRLKEVGDYSLLLQNNRSLHKNQIQPPVKIVLNNDWDVAFQSGRGAPSNAHFNTLISYTEHSDKGVKYFSGKAVYQKTFRLDAGHILNSKIVFLELGQVKNVATIIVNGKKVRTFWKPPFEVEITAWCKAGENSLQVEVTNLWPNRMIGDEWEPDDSVWGEVRTFKYSNPPAKIGRNLQVIPDWMKNKTERPSNNRITFSTMDFFDKTDPLLLSGLLGPVKVTVEDKWELS